LASIKNLSKIKFEALSYPVNQRLPRIVSAANPQIKFAVFLKILSNYAISSLYKTNHMGYKTEMANIVKIVKPLLYNHINFINIFIRIE